MLRMTRAKPVGVTASPMIRMRDMFASSMLLTRLLRDHAEVRDRRAFSHRGHRANIKDNSRHRRPSFEDCLSDVVSDVAKLHSLFNVRSALHEWIEDSVLIAGDGHHLFDPHGMLDHLRLTGQHLQITHYVQAAVDERVEIVCLNCTGMS